jgi:hypothetical protein
VRPPLVLVVEGAVAVAVTVALDGMPKEPLVLTDVPAFLPPASCPLGDDTGELLLIVSGWLSGCAWKSLASTRGKGCQFFDYLFPGWAGRGKSLSTILC